MRSEDYPEILLVEEVAEYLRVNKQTIYNLLRQGQLPAKKIGGQWRFHKKAIDEYLIVQAIVPAAATKEEE
ncbi:MAG: helix-turn-helix domain-containing protein [Halanaerobiales bacterium]|nr:helix-turn-helix domain-containing protein [Halanaerobiales bacterium]